MSMAITLAGARCPALLDSWSVWSPVSPRTTASPPTKQTSVSPGQQQPRPAGQFPDPIAAMPHDLVPANSAGAVSDTACAHFTKNRLVSEEIGNFGFETKLLLADITFVSKAIRTTVLA